MSGNTINWKGAILCSILIALAAIAILYFVWKDGPVYTAVNAVLAKINLPQINTGSIGTLLSNNWTTVTGIGLTAIPLGYTTIKSYIDKQKAKRELEAAQELAKISQSQTALEIQGLKDQIATYSTDTTASELQKTILQFKSENDILKTRYNEAQATITRLQLQLDARPVIKTRECV